MTMTILFIIISKHNWCDKMRLTVSSQTVRLSLSVSVSYSHSSTTERGRGLEDRAGVREHCQTWWTAKSERMKEKTNVMINSLHTNIFLIYTFIICWKEYNKHKLWMWECIQVTKYLCQWFQILKFDLQIFVIIAKSANFILDDTAHNVQYKNICHTLQWEKARGVFD